jgi:phospholipid/cholesterol/gamma-HCH transport system substrate-binding protein
MDERSKQFRVGVVAIATIVITAILITWHSDFATLPFAKRYQVQMLVGQAPGVATNTPVRRRGLLIGRVVGVEATDEGALLTLSIDEDKAIKTNEVGRIQASLLGDAVIEFLPASSSVGARQVAPGQVVKGIYSPTPLDMLGEIQGDLRQTVISLGDAGKEVAELANRLNAVLGGSDMERIQRIAESLDTAVSEFGSVMGNIDDIVSDENFKEQVKTGLAQLPSLVTDARAIMQALQGVVGSANQNLDNLQGLTGPLGERGPQIVDVVEQSIRNLEQLLGEVATFTSSINRSEGTVGMLIRDRQLYDQVTATIAQASSAIQDVRLLIANVEVMSRRLRPILDDVRVFTDKIARDPARLARGVINRETPIK